MLNREQVCRLLAVLAVNALTAGVAMVAFAVVARLTASPPTDAAVMVLVGPFGAVIFGGRLFAPDVDRAVTRWLRGHRG